MTARHSGYFVVLGDDIREDDAQEIISAIKMIKGVRSVVPQEASWEECAARERRDDVWRGALYDLARKGPQ